MTTNLENVQTFKILIIGNAGVGKSSLMTRYVHGIFHFQYTATIGVDFQVAIINIGEYKCRLQIWCVYICLKFLVYLIHVKFFTFCWSM